MDYYSIKMRASQQAGDGGGEAREKHISGAERIIVSRESAEEVCAAMVRRAMFHSRGEPDRINIRIEKFSGSELQILRALPVKRIEAASAREGLERAFGLVFPILEGGYDRGLSRGKLREKFRDLLRETFSMRGAMLYDIASGKRLEPDPARGVRATYMDALHSSGVDGEKNHFHEAIVLATKVANAPGMAAEFCVSDDPNYVTGYVAGRELGYVRIMKMKEPGDVNGGRIFLFDSRRASAEACIEYLQAQKVLVEV